MNKIYKVIYCKATQTWVAVSEITKSHGKGGVRGTRRSVTDTVVFGGQLKRITLAVLVGLGVFNSQAWAVCDTYGVNVVCGANTTVEGNGSGQRIAIGGGVGTGSGASATGDQAIAIGGNTEAGGDSSIAIGGDDTDKAAVKKTTLANGSTVTVGEAFTSLTGKTLNDDGRYHDTKSNGTASIAIGVKATASGDLSTAFGTATNAGGLLSTAIGVGANADKQNAVAIGAGSKTDVAGSKQTGTTIGGTSYSWQGGIDIEGGDVVSIGSAGFERQLKNVAAGAVSEKSTDAINGSQLYAVAQELDRQNYFHVNDGTATQPLGDATTNSGTVNAKGGAIGTNALAAGGNAQASGVNAIAIGQNAKVLDDKIFLGNGTAVGANAISGPQSVAVGSEAQTSFVNKKGITKPVGKAVAIGYQAQGLKGLATAVGYQAEASTKGVAIGSDSHSGAFTYDITTNTYTFDRANKSVTQTTAIGDLALASGDQATALGANTKAIGNSSIAIGGDDLDKVASKAGTVLPGWGVAVADEKTAEGLNNTDVAEKYKALTGDILVHYENTKGNPLSGTYPAHDPVHNGPDGSPVRYKSTTSGAGGVAVGVSSTAADLATAFGTRANADGDASMALGVGSHATMDNSIAIGAGSQTDVVGTSQTGTVIDGVAYNWAGGIDIEKGDVVSIGSHTKKEVTKPDGTTVMKSFERQLKNVAAGAVNETSTDAINGSQLHSMTSKLQSMAKEANQDTYFHTNAGATLITDPATAGYDAATLTNAGYNANNLAKLDGVGGATGTNSLAAGVKAQAQGASSTAVGHGATAVKDNTIAVGHDAKANEQFAIAIGTNGTVADKNSALAIGNNADATKTNSIAIGHDVDAEAQKTVVVGYNSKASGTNAVAIGHSNNIAQDNTFVLGNSVTTTQANSVVLGNASTDKAATAVNSATVGTGASAVTYSGFAGVGSATNGVVSVGSVGGERQIINVAAGEISKTSTDAINGSQLYSIATELDRQNYFHTNPNAAAATGNDTNLADVDGIGGAKGGRSLAAGLEAQAVSTGAVAVGYKAKAEGSNSVAAGSAPNAPTAMGDSTTTNVASGVALGASAHAHNDSALAGDYASVYSMDETAFNNLIGSTRKGFGATALGAGAQAYNGTTGDVNSGSTAIGFFSQAKGGAAVGVGTQAKAMADKAVAVGYYAKADKASSIALGNSATANTNDGVALGSNSLVTRAALTGVDTSSSQIASVGTGGASKNVYAHNSASDAARTAIINTVKGNLGAVSVGNADNTRQIINVAAGSEDTDAVNVAQLRAVAASSSTPWKLMKTGGDKNEIGGGDTVEFEDGTNTTAVVTNEVGGVTKVKINTKTSDITTDATGKSTAAAPDSLATAGDIAKAINASGFTAKANGDAGKLIKSGEEVEFLNGDNIAITRDGGKFTVATSKDVAFDKVTVGNVAIDKATNKITGLEAGTDDKDAVNVSQLNKVRDVANAGFKVKGASATVTGKDDTIKPNETLNIIGATINTDFAKSDAGSNIFTQVNDDNTVTIGLAKDVKDINSVTLVNPKDTTKTSTLSSNADGDLDVGGDKITNVGAGDISSISTDAVNGSQIKAISDSNATIFGGNATVQTDGTITMSDVGDTGKTNIHDAIKSINAATTTANKGFTIAGNSDKKGTTDKTIKPTDTFTVVGADKNTDFSQSDEGKNIYTQVSDNKITVALAKEIDVDKVTVQKGLTVAKGATVNMGNNVVSKVSSGLVDAKGNAVTIADATGDTLTNAANIGDLQKVQTNVQSVTQEVANVTKKTTNVAEILGSATEIDPTTGVATKEGQLALKTYSVKGQEEKVNNTVISAIKSMNEGGIKYFHTNDTANNYTTGDKNSQDSSAGGAYSTAIGFNAKTKSGAEGSVAVGRNTEAGGISSVAIGDGSKATGKNSISIGTGNQVSGNNSGAIGDPSIINGANSYSVGNNNTVSATVSQGSFILGNSVDATVDNSVYLGNDTMVTAGTAVGTANLTSAGTAGATTTAGDTGTVNSATVNGITYGGFAGAQAHGAVSVGAAGSERRVQNVAAGEISATSTDAINGSQLYNSMANVNNNINSLYQAIGDARDDAHAGTASALAAANLPQPHDPGANMVSAAIGTYEGQSAVSIGVSAISDNGKWIIKGSLTHDTQDNTGAGIGIGYQW